MNKLLMLITAIAVMLGGQAFMAPAANASAPTVALSDIRYGTASFSANGSAAATASLKTRTGVKIYLNVQVNPMTKNQIKPGTCRKAPVGKWFYNEMIDPATGKHYYKHMRVQAGDNVFCKDRNGVWRKKSCRNKAKGLFGVPKPPRTLIKLSGVIQDYLEWSGELEVKSSQSGSALAHVVQYHEGQKVCEAKATTSGSALAYVRMWVKVKSRTKVGISVTAANSAKVKASTSTTVQGMLKARVETSIKGNAMAMCNFTPPPPPPPTHDECPNIPGDQPPGYECNPPPPPVVYEKPLAEIWAGEHAVDENGTTTVWGRIKCDARLTCLLNRPTDNSDLGEMVSWMQGSVEDGWLRFSGTWRNANTLPPGEHTVTLTAVGTDSQGQTVPATTTLKVVKVVHPET